MVMRVNHHRERKVARVAQEWPGAGAGVFKALGVSRAELEQLEHRLAGHIVLPGMPDYDQDRQEAILTPYTANPQIIVYCAVIGDVRLCLEWAHRYGWWVTCRSGGHSFAGYSVNTGLVIDLSGLNYVVVDAVLKQARVGPGTQFQQLNATLDTYKLHVPGGTCPDVAVAGYMQGGGYGLTSREFGIHCDSVLEVTVMLHDGRIAVANAEKNRDLFWAIRGGTGGNFGVLLETTYRLYDLHEVWGFCLQWPLDAAPAVLRELQAHYTTKGAPERLGYMAVLGVPQSAPGRPAGPAAPSVPQGPPALLMMGLYHGSRAQGLRALKSVQAIAQPAMPVDQVGPYAEINDAVFGVLAGPAPGQPMVTRGGYISQVLDVGDWQRLAETVASMPNPYNVVGIEAYGGAINAYPPGDNAFVHRDVSMNLFAFAFLDQAGGNEQRDAEWLQSFAGVMQPYWNGGAYQNYPVRDFPDFRQAYWGDAFPTLLFVKQKYDPDNFFHYEQSISPYPDGQDIGRSTARPLFTDSRIEYEPYS